MKLFQISPLLYRGSRPSASDLPLLTGKGIRVIVSLEGPDEDAKEAREFAPGIEVHSMPISPLEIYMTGISEQYLVSIVRQMSSALVPILVHCQHGEDRTGLIVAAWRVKTGWPKQMAWQEAKDFGYRWYLNFGLNRTWAKLG